MSEEAAQKVAEAVRQVLRRYRYSGARDELSKYNENALHMELQAALDQFRYTRNNNVPLADFYFQLIPVSIPEDKLPTKEERVARVFMDLDPYPAAFACRLGLKFTEIQRTQNGGFAFPDMSNQEYTVLVTSENDKETIEPW
jgi:hypothetical protein